ncbi:MAG: DNA translocase FtsK [Bacteriovoracia bacterium]
MAKKKKEEKKIGKSKEALGLIFLFFGVVFASSLLSYHYSDPSFFHKTNQIPKNLMGSFGSNISEVLFQILGFPSFLFAIFFFFLAYRSFVGKGVKLVQISGNALWIILCIVSFCTFLGIHLSSFKFGGARIAAGGLVGATLAPKLISVVNPWGATVISLFVFLFSLVVSVPFRLFSIFIWTVSLLRAAAEFAQEVYNNKKTERLLKKNASPEIILKKTLEIAEPKKKVAVEIKESAEQQDLSEDFIEEEKIASKPKKKKQLRARPEHYALPPLSFLKEDSGEVVKIDKDTLYENSKTLEAKLKDFGIEGQIEAVRPGPVITMYEFKPGPGVKISQIAALADDLSLAVSAQSVRIVAPIPGRGVVGIEIPNETRQKVLLRELLETEEFQKNQTGIPIAVGKEIGGTPVVTDLTKMPHLLIAGAPGAGKSVFINSLICSLLYKFSPDELRLIMVDPKQLELNLYEDIPHLLLPIVDDPRKASTALKWGVNEMERRYKIMAMAGVRNVAGFNERLQKEGTQKMRELLCPVLDTGLADPKSVAHLLDHDEAGQPKVEVLPNIMVIIDEFADLMMVAPKDIELSVARLAQKARAAAIHLVIATQRPSVDVVTGLIKANLPSRISFQVASKVDSRTIIDSSGAEKLLGQGDMLFIPPGLARLTRLHGAYVSEAEIEQICEHWRAQGSPEYREEILIEEPDSFNADGTDGGGDSLYPQAVSIVKELRQASASMLQRRLKVGYNRAARMIEAMEAQGIVGPADGAKPREVLQ